MDMLIAAPSVNIAENQPVITYLWQFKKLKKEGFSIELQETHWLLVLEGKSRKKKKG